MLDGDVLRVAWARSMRFVLGWADPAGTKPGVVSSGHARWVLAERRAVHGVSPASAVDVLIYARGALDRPSEGAVANTGRFVISDHLAGDGMASVLQAFELDGKLILRDRFGANTGLLAVSVDGRHAVVETMNNAVDPQSSNRLLAYDLDQGTRLWDIPRRTNIGRLWIDQYKGTVGCLTRAGRLATVLLMTGEADDNWDPIGSEDNNLTERVPDQGFGDPFWELEVLEAGVRWKLATASQARALRMLARSERIVDALFGYPRRQARCLRLHGQILERLGRPDDAVRAYRRGLDYDPRLGVRRRLKGLGFASAAYPRSAPRPTTEPDLRPYASTTCPSCGAGLSPLPRAKSKCRACGSQIWVRGAPDGRRHLLRHDQLDAHQARWDQWWGRAQPGAE
ncbi:MAG: hypothetical protein C0498_12845 [Anaerolinea sp.]|nr:hypothetical protein [Anaerolinea sp.]